MADLRELITTLMTENKLLQATLSQVRKKEVDSYKKVTIKLIEIKGTLLYQFSFYFEQKVLHENLASTEAIDRTLELMDNHFKQGLFHSIEADYQVLISKKGKATILKKKSTIKEVNISHNRKKNYIIEEGKPVPFLIELGVMNEEGKVLAKKYDKFKQINRFLEMIQDIVPHLNQKETVKIIDFGCGKSYLTFAMHYYLREIRNLNVQITGLDLKKDVIKHCQSLAEKYQYNDLKFIIGDITDYNQLGKVDMVVTLHACDTATDAALEKAVRWGADVILSVPCCQHELNSQIEQEILNPLLRHGIIKERISSLATDSIRAQLLDIVGYKTQILEFIDMEHTPKNILIRAIKAENSNKEELLKEYKKLKEFLHVEPYLEKALSDLIESIS